MENSDDRQTRKLSDLRLILKDFLKVIKVVAMYPEDNPLPQSLRRTFAERLVDLVEDYGSLEFRIKKDKLRYENETVFEDRDTDERLAGMFFDTGINRIAFRPGIEVDDIYRLLDAVKAYQNSNRTSRDLAALLWEAEIRGFGFETVEDIALGQYDGEVLNPDLGDSDDNRYGFLATDDSRPYGDIFADNDDADPLSDSDPAIETAFLGEDSTEIRLNSSGSVLSTGDDSRDSELNISTAVKAMGLDDARPDPRLPDTNLILNDELRLSEEETEEVENLRRVDADFELYESTTELLKEILHQESELADFNESVTICEKVLSEFVEHGKLTFAADLLRYFGQLDDQIRAERPLWGERLKQAKLTAGGRERLTALCDALNEHDSIGAHELNRYLDNFDWTALMPLTDLLGALEHPHHLSAVRDFLTERGRDRVAIVARGIDDKSDSAARSAVAVLAAIGTDEALKYLGRAVEHRSEEVRYALVTGLAECPSAKALPLLLKLFNDSDAQIRAAAISAIVSRGGQGAFDTLTDMVNDERFGHLDQNQQRSILIAYSRIGGDAAVDYLIRIIDDFSLLGKSRNATLRQIAFEALAHNRGDKAEKALLKRSGSWRGEIKQQAKRALQQRREMIYGESDD